MFFYWKYIFWMPSIRTQQLQMCTIETSQARLNAAVMMKYCLTITAFKKKDVLSALDKEVNQRWSLSLYLYYMKSCVNGVIDAIFIR